MKRLTLLLFLLLPLFSPSYALTKLDSLKLSLSQHISPDSVRVNLLNQLGYQYWIIDPVQSELYGSEALQLSQTLHFRRGQAFANRIVGVSHWARGNYAAALRYLLDGLELYQALRDADGTGTIFNNIGMVYLDQRSYPEALAYFNLSLEKIKEKGGNTQREAGVLGNLGNTYFQMKEYAQAEKIYRHVLQMNQRMERIYGIADSYSNLGELDLVNGRLESALAYLFKSIQLRAPLQDREGVAKCLYLIGKAYVEQGKYSQAENYLQQGIDTAQKVNTRKWLTHIFQTLKELEVARGNYQKAFMYSEQFSAVKDSLFDVEKSRQIAEMQARFKTLQQERSLIVKQKELQILQEQAQRQSLLRTVLLIIMLVLAAMAYLIISRQRFKIQKNKEVLSKSQQLDAQNQQLDAKNQQLEEQANQLKRQTQQLQELDEMKSNFFANISHEFRTPLTMILGTLNDKLAWFRERSDTKEVIIPKPEVNVMHRNAHRLLQLINQLLDLSKIESGKMNVHLRHGDLKSQLLVTTASFSSLADFRRIRFLVHLPETPLYCLYDSEHMEKILYNLLSNAFKFTPPDGEIKLEAHVLTDTNEKRIRIVVQDSGVGIAPEQVNRVFDRFFQGSNQYQGDQHGTGIGLALTRELVQQLGGKIWAESEPDQGARFNVELPFVELQTEENNLSIQENTLPELSTKASYSERFFPDEDGLAEQLLAVSTDDAPVLESVELKPVLLIVEDNDDLRRYIRNHLEKQYHVLESENGLKGWQTALATLPDLIISDWMMPDMDGIELCKQIKTDERTSHIPFILLTALATNEGKLTGLETGADEYLTKPFDAQELGLRVRNLVDSRRRLRERFGRELRIQPKDITVTSMDEQFMQRVMAIAEANLGNAEFSAEQFGQEVGLSRMQLHRKLSALTGQSASDFIRTMRLKRAAQLLEGQAGTVSEIAYQVGFNSLSYFSKCFREQFGVMASEYTSAP